jgi:hypothetical protein
VRENMSGPTTPCAIRIRNDASPAKKSRA